MPKIRKALALSDFLVALGAKAVRRGESGLLPEVFAEKGQQARQAQREREEAVPPPDAKPGRSGRDCAGPRRTRMG